jgi:putative ABC transport system permease protein
MQIGILIAEIFSSWRALSRQPRYLLLAASTLALGIAATTAVFSLINQVLLRPLPFPQPDRLVSIGLIPEGEGVPIGAPAIYRRLVDMPSVSSFGIANAYLRDVNVVSGDTPVIGSVLIADRGFLRTLNIDPLFGRNFSEDEDRQGGERVALLSAAFWKAHFGADRSIVGRSVMVEGGPITIVGVLPERFVWPEPFDMLTPMRLAPDSQDMDTNQFVIARLASDADIAEVGREADRRFRELMNEFRPQIGQEAFDFFQKLPFSTVPLQQIYSGGARDALWMFFAAAVCVLAIAAINLANLVMLRVIVRSHDSAVRSALGASAARLMLPTLGEALLIGLLGALVGAALAWAGLRLLAAFVPPEWLGGAALGIDGIALLFALALGVFAALSASAFGLWRGGRRNLLGELVGGGRTGLSRGAGTMAKILVVAQVAIAVVLLTGAGLFMHSLYRMVSVPLGFAQDRTITFTLAPVRRVYTDIAAVDRQTHDVIERLRRLRGVDRVAVSSNLPTGSQLNFPATLADGRTIQPQFRPINPEFFSTFEIAVLAGREFERNDGSGAEPVCIVSRAFAEQFFAGDAIGQTVRMGRGDSPGSPQMRVVGVVADVRHEGPAADPSPMLYVPISQLSEGVWSAVREFSPLHYAVRVEGPIAEYEPELRRAVAEISPLQAIDDVRSLQNVVDDTMRDARLQLLLVGVFAALALLLAGVGLYAILAVTAASRGHEYGVRIALGAKPSTLVARVLKETAIQIALGLALGLGLSLALSKLIQSFLFEIRVTDPIAMTGVIVALAVIGLAASFVPAWRAARTDPMRALRSE